MKLIESSIKSGIVGDLNKKLVRLTVGSKNVFKDISESINVLTMLKKVDEDIPGFFRSYEDLSEIAHPNWAGSGAVFSKDMPTLITHFRRGIRETASSQRLGLRCLIGSLDIFSFAYNKVSDFTPLFACICEQEIARKSVG